MTVYLDFMTIKLYGRNQTMCQKEERQILRYCNILNYEPDISLNRIRALFCLLLIRSKEKQITVYFKSWMRGGEKRPEVLIAVYICVAFVRMFRIFYFN